MSEHFHKRKLIRDSVFQMLKDGFPTGIKTFSKNRFLPFNWDKEALPALSIYLISENSEIFDEGPRRFKRTLQIAVELVLELKDEDYENLDDSLDEYCRKIENILLVDETFRGTVSDSFLSGTEIIEKPDGEYLTASAIMAFEATYYTVADYPGLRNFTGLDGNFIAGGEDTPKMPIEIDVEQ